jgi:hypothetical protein
MSRTTVQTRQAATEKWQMKNITTRFNVQCPPPQQVLLLLVLNLVQTDYYEMAHGKAWQGK